ncbi:MAG: hypothetical protein R3Y57_07175, partial [Erysipelotrichaceae bacterium]
CYEYTTSLTTIRDWLAKGRGSEIEMGHYLKGVDYPVYKVPAIKNCIVSDTQYLQEDALYDVLCDPAQLENKLEQPVVETMIELMKKALEENDAPIEQFERLGLNKM